MTQVIKELIILTVCLIKSINFKTNILESKSVKNKSLCRVFEFLVKIQSLKCLFNCKTSQQNNNLKPLIINKKITVSSK